MKIINFNPLWLVALCAATAFSSDRIDVLRDEQGREQLKSKRPIKSRLGKPLKSQSRKQSIESRLGVRLQPIESCLAECSQPSSAPKLLPVPFAPTRLLSEGKTKVMIVERGGLCRALFGIELREKNPGFDEGVISPHDLVVQKWKKALWVTRLDRNVLSYYQLGVGVANRVGGYQGIS